MTNNYEIGVLGDAMIDEYYSIDMKGISPEFPIPTMSSLDDTPLRFPGGAANVANQFKHFKDVDVFLISFLDSFFIELFSKKLNLDYSLKIDGFLPVKKRFYSSDIPIFRWDVEKKFFGLKDIRKSILDLINLLDSLKKNLNALIISDYDKGTVSLLDKRYIDKNLLTVVDSKSQFVEKWFDCDIFKSNFKEAKAISGAKTPEAAANYILSLISCKNVVITNAEKGVVVANKQGVTNIDPDSSIDAKSVVGAGDCFTAMLTYFFLQGYSIEDSSYYAWKAGNKYVQRMYNTPLCPSDLIEDKIVKNPKDLKNRDFKLVFTNGCFDLIHSGHIDNLKFARSQGDKLVVALNTDDSISKIKVGRPIQCLEDRAKILSSFNFVDFVVFFDEETPIKVIEEIRPDILVKGSEYGLDEIVGSHTIKQVVTFPMVEGKSTTNLIERIKGENQ